MGLGERQRKLSILMGNHRELKKKINSYKQKGENIHALAIKALEKDRLNVEQQRAHVIMEIL